MKAKIKTAYEQIRLDRAMAQQQEVDSASPFLGLQVQGRQKAIDLSAAIWKNNLAVMECSRIATMSNPSRKTIERDAPALARLAAGYSVPVIHAATRLVYGKR